MKTNAPNTQVIMYAGVPVFLWRVKWKSHWDGVLEWEMERSSDVSLILLWLFTQSDSPSHPWPSIHPAKRSHHHGEAEEANDTYWLISSSPEGDQSFKKLYVSGRVLLVYLLPLCFEVLIPPLIVVGLLKFLKHANLLPPLPYENNYSIFSSELL